LVEERLLDPSEIVFCDFSFYLVISFFSFFVFYFFYFLVCFFTASTKICLKGRPGGLQGQKKEAKTKYGAIVEKKGGFCSTQR
jgi:hypothetical protein